MVSGTYYIIEGSVDRHDSAPMTALAVPLIIKRILLTKIRLKFTVGTVTHFIFEIAHSRVREI